MSEEIDIAGVKVKAGGKVGKLFMYATAAGAVIGALYGGFEVYKDYMDMKDKIASYSAPDLSGFDKQLATLKEQMVALKEETKLMDENMMSTGERVSDIKNDLRDDLVRMEKIIDQIEDKVQKNQTDVRSAIQNAEERFENKRDALQNDYDQAKDRLTVQTGRELKDLEARLNKRLQRALDNPLANN